MQPTWIPPGTRGLPQLSVNFHLGIWDQLIVILRCFHQSVPRCRSRLQEQREPAKCKCWQREQRNDAGLLVKYLPTARSLPAPPRRFQHVPLQGQLARLYNLSRRFEGVSLSSMDLRRLPLMGDRVPLEGTSAALPAGAVVTGGQTLQ